MNQPRTYLVGQKVACTGDYICNMCGTRQFFSDGDRFGPCRVCGNHANAWTWAEDIDQTRRVGNT